MKQQKQNTIKKVKVIGNQQYINFNTGEIEDFQVTSVEERDFNFTKVWMKSFISTLDLVGNQKTKLAFWLIENLNKENQLTMTYRQISEKTNISLETVRKTMAILLEVNFLKRINQGVYQVNPDILFKGNKNTRLNLLTQYNNLDNQENEKELTLQKKLNNIQSTILKLNQEAEKILKKLQENKQENKSEKNEK